MSDVQAEPPDASVLRRSVLGSKLDAFVAASSDQELAGSRLGGGVPHRPARAGGAPGRDHTGDAPRRAGDADASGPFPRGAGRRRDGVRVREVDRAVPASVRRVRPAWWARYTRLVVAADAVACATVLALVQRATRGDDGPAAVAALVVPVLLLAWTLAGAYQHRFLGHGLDEFRRLLAGGAAVVATAAAAGYGLDRTGHGRALVLAGLPAALATAVAVHCVARGVLRRLRRYGRCRQRAVVIGLERSVAEMVRAARLDRHAGLEVVAACVAASRSDVVEGVPVMGVPAEAMRVLMRARADTVVLTAWSDVDPADLRRLAWDLEGSGAELLVAPRLSEVASPRMHIRTLAGQPLLTVEEPEFTGVRRVAKSLLDRGLALAALLVLAPVMLAVALAVRLDSPGPVLFRQERVGRHARHFRMTKFRSMYTDAEQRLAALANESDGPLFKVRADPRVTRVGRVIRRYSLDELPQLFDVLAGSMALVGPRPPLPREVSAYEQDVRRRLLVKPGITGLWQVSGRSDLPWEEAVRLDLSYVENWSLWLDLSIIARTVTAVLAGRGAY